uniref:RecQ-mediated genome instability protein 1 n=1 Tax=Elaeophora elaphi TaxID=1147741 RepID=A0A0R3RXT8_9BILA
MLSMEVTDGQLSMKAVEYGPLNALSLLTCPGCKILLRNNVCLRRGILLLTELNCVVLGGDDDLLMKTSRPVEIMIKRLNISISLKRQSFISSTKTKKEIDQLVLLSDLFLFKKSSVNCGVPKANNTPSQPNMKPIMQVKPLSGKKLSSETPKRKMIPGNETTGIEQTMNNVGQGINVSLNEIPSSSGSRTPITTSATKRSEESSSYTTLFKRMKTEVTDDEADIILLETPTSAKQQISNENDPRRTNLSAKKLAESSFIKVNDDPIVAAYKMLGVESIAVALQTMRYALGPRRKILAAVMETKPLEPLHVNNDRLWALTVALSDDSYEHLTCFVSHKFLVELIGWTPDEALDARASKDPARRKEGTLRTRSAGQSMRRLDLIWEVEFFPPGGSTPIIHKIDTYAQKLGLIR